MREQRNYRRWIFTIIVFQFSLFTAYTDELPCASLASYDYSVAMKNSMQAFEEFKVSFQRHHSSAGRISGSLKKNSIPVKIHIVRQDNGLTSLDTAYMRKGINFMNRTFEGAGLEFYICGSYNYINSSTYYSLDNTEYETLNTNYGTLNVINLFFVNQISHYGASAGGVAPTPGGSDWLAIRNSADTVVYPHEMGHFFGLLHTHGYSNVIRTAEFVDGSNCQESGDYFCDTPADPRLSPAIVNGANVNAQCIYFGNLKDGHNQTYVPDARNIMSYAPNKCLTHFSPDQLAYMHWVYINRRANLTCSSVNVNFNTSTSSSCDSPYVFRFLKQTAGVTNLQWDVDDDGIADYTSNNPSHTYTNPGLKWVSLSGVFAGKTYTRYKPVEILVPYTVPKLIDFNSSTMLPSGWRLYNPDYGRGWEIAEVKGMNGQLSGVLRFRNFNYSGYEEEDAIYTNAFDLRGFKNARLTFDVAYAPHNSTDTLIIYASADCGNTFPYQILKIGGAALQTHPKQFQEFIPDENDWKNMLISLNNYVNNYVSFKIVNYNTGGNNLYIDNIRVEGGDSTLSEIGFASTLFNTSESSISGQLNCRGFRVVSVPVFIASAPSAAVTVNVTATGSASGTHDYELITGQVVFPAGQTGNQWVQIRIMDDAASEGMETILLQLSIQGLSGFQTTAKNRICIINLYDNDAAGPESKLCSTVLLEEKFETVSQTTYIPAGWGGSGNFIGTDALGSWFYDGESATFNNSLDSTDYILYWGDAGSINAPMSVYLESPEINLSHYDSLTVEMDHWLKSLMPYTGDVVVEVWNGAAWTTVYMHPSLQGNIGLNFKPEHVLLSLSGYNNTDFKVRFGLINERSSYWYVIDNVKITGFKTKAKVSKIIK
jgi:PKD repeat protein